MGKILALAVSFLAGTAHSGDGFFSGLVLPSAAIARKSELKQQWRGCVQAVLEGGGRFTYPFNLDLWVQRSSKAKERLESLPPFMQELIAYAKEGKEEAWWIAEAKASQLYNRLDSYSSEMHALPKISNTRGNQDAIRRRQQRARILQQAALNSVGNMQWPDRNGNKIQLDAKDLVQHPGRTLAHLRQAIHLLEGLHSGNFHMQKPSLLKFIEQIKSPNFLRALFLRHFELHPKELLLRKMVDIGAWDGQLTHRVTDGIFGSVLAVEPDAERYEGMSLLHENAGFQTFHMTAQEFAEKYEAKADVILLSHVLYYFRHRNPEQMNDFDLIDWSIQNVGPDGLVVITLNDMDASLPATRAHLRNWTGAEETNPKIELYTNYLRERGIPYDVLYPQFRLQYESDSGRQVLAELLSFLMQRRVKDHPENAMRLAREYIDQFVEPQKTFTHRLAVLVVGNHNVIGTTRSLPVAPENLAWFGETPEE